MRTAVSEMRCDWLVMTASGLLYLGVALAYWPTLAAAVSGLDDARTLETYSHAPLSSVWGFDRFGHLRPAKSLWMYAVAHALPLLPLFRGCVLAAFLASGALLQRLAAQLVARRWSGLAAAAVWMGNPTAPAVVCWLSAANLAFAGLGVLAYLSAALRGQRMLACAALLFAVANHELATLAPVLWLAWERLCDARRSEPARRWLVRATSAVLLLWAAAYVLLPQPPVEYRVQAPSWLLSLASARYLWENLRLWLWLPGAFGALYHDRPEHALWASALAWLAALALLVLCVRTLRERALQLALLWTLLLLVPVIDLLPLRNTPVALHYAYLPGMGLGLGAAWLGTRSQLTAAMLLLLVAAWQPAGHAARSAFSDDALLYELTLRDHPDAIEARANLASVYLERKQYERAAALLTASLARAPSDPMLLRNQLDLLLETDRLTEALAVWRAHPELIDSCEEALRWGETLERTQQPSAAAFARALALARTPEERKVASYDLLRALIVAHRTSEARDLTRQLLRDQPDDPNLQLTQKLLEPGVP